MIHLYNGEALPVRQSRAAVQFCSLYHCYGNCSVVQFWYTKGASLFAMGGTLYIDDCGQIDIQELAAFIRVMGFCRVYCSRKLAENAGWPLQAPVVELVQNRPCHLHLDKTELKLQEIYHVLQESGGAIEMPPFADFCVDFSHRLRHGGARRIGDGRGLAITTAETKYFACIGGVAVLPAYRGEGLGSKLVQALCTELQSEGKQIITFTTPELLPFYQKNGFVPYRLTGYAAPNR